MRSRWMVMGALGLQLAFAVGSGASTHWRPEEGDLIALASTVLDSAVYEEEARVLVIKFRGGTSYEYYGVNDDVFQELLRTEDKGRYFNAHIRNVYACERITN